MPGFVTYRAIPAAVLALFVLLASARLVRALHRGRLDRTALLLSIAIVGLLGALLAWWLWLGVSRPAEIY